MAVSLHSWCQWKSPSPQTVTAWAPPNIHPPLRTRNIRGGLAGLQNCKKTERPLPPVGRPRQYCSYHVQHTRTLPSQHSLLAAAAHAQVVVQAQCPDDLR